MRNIFYIIAIVVLLVVGFFAFNNYIYNQKQEDAPIMGFDSKNASYVISGEVVRLIDGRSADNRITYFGNEARGDINGDGIEDVVALISQMVDANTNRFYLVGGIAVEGRLEGTQAVMIGDNIRPQTTEIVGVGLVNVNYGIQQGENSIDNPTLGKTLRLKFDSRDNSWGEVVSDFEGEADPAKMTLTMKPWTWVSARRGDDALIAPRNPEKFVLTFTPDGNFSATTDCNRMGGSYTASGTALTFGQMFSTKMFCEDSQEQLFADILTDVISYRFTSKGELIMGVKVEGEAVFR